MEMRKMMLFGMVALMVLMMTMSASAYVLDTVFSDDFEAGTSNFTAAPGGQWGAPGGVDGNSQVNGTYSYRVIPGGSSFLAYAVTPVFTHTYEDYSGGNSYSMLSFWTRISAQDETRGEYDQAYYKWGIGFDDIAGEIAQDEYYESAYCNANSVGIYFVHEVNVASPADTIPYICRAGSSTRIGGNGALSDGLYYITSGHNGDTLYEVNIYDENMTLLFSDSVSNVPDSFNDRDDQLFIWATDEYFYNSGNVDAYFDDIVYTGNTEVPDWSCTGYEEPTCLANDTTVAACNNVTDLNGLGESYSGDYSEFPDQVGVCDYCVVNTTGFFSAEHVWRVV
jgi:hypothetical protein